MKREEHRRKMEILEEQHRAKMSVHGMEKDLIGMKIEAFIDEMRSKRGGSSGGGVGVAEAAAWGVKVEKGGDDDDNEQGEEEEEKMEPKRSVNRGNHGDGASKGKGEMSRQQSDESIMLD